MTSRPGLLALTTTVLMAFGVAGCAPADEAMQAALPLDGPRTLILTAMPIELAPFVEAAEVEHVEAINGRRHHVGWLDGQPVVMAAFGISMVNAAMGAQAALDHFDIDAVIVAGIAGGASPEIAIGDVTVPARWAQYQEHVFTAAERTGWRRGWRNEDLGSFGMMFPQRVWSTAEGRPLDDEHLKLWFEADAEWLAAASALGDAVLLERCTDAGDCLEHTPQLRVGGNGVSGPTFVDDAEYRDWVWQTFAPDGFDMETAAIGHVAYVNGVPFVGVRAISDMAGANPNENRVESFAPIAARNAAAVVRAMLASR